jgi:aminoglycoside phosphotransferase family enzyme
MELLDFLSNPLNYPEKSRSLKIVQTHISFIFILDEYVYKIKKPVNFGFLDFTSLEKRKYFCFKEIEVNKKLAKNIYIGVFPISKINDGYEFSDKNPVEYAVKMKKLPEELIFSNLIKKGVKQQDLIRISLKIANFHNEAEVNDEILSMGEIEKIKVNTDENFEQTEKYKGITISPRDHEFIKRNVDKFYEKYGKIFKERIENRKIKDCHGDLRMEHICVLRDDIVIFDAIEFNERFRYHDILNDFAFLMMEMDYEGYKKEKEIIEREWFKICEKEIKEEVIKLYYFYLSYRSFVRGKVTSFLLQDPYINYEEKEKIKNRAKKFFELSKEYIEKLINF